jgi:lipopolysaccharide export system protein LptA
MHLTKARHVMSALPLAALLALGGLPALAQEATQKTEVSGQRLSGLRLSRDEPIQIESDKLEVKEPENLAIFTGNVTVTQGPTTLRSGRMIVYYEQDGGSATTGSSKIDRLQVDGKVYVKSNNQVATGDTGTFDMKSEVLVLSGKEVVLSEGPNVLVGCKLTVQMKSGRAQVDSCPKSGSGGRVQMSITPGSGN